MARNFTITTPSETVRVAPDGTGEMTFTVTNVNTFPTRGLAKVVPQGNTNAEWLTLDNVEREFPAGGVQQFRVKANIPPGTPPAKVSYRFDMVSAVKSGEESDAGPVVAFEVAAAEPKKKGIPWWVWLAIVIGVLVIAVVAWLKFRKPPPPPPPPEVTKVTVPDVEKQEIATAILKLQDLGFDVVLEPHFIDADPRVRILLIPTVLDQRPDPGTPADKGSTVTLVVQRIRGRKVDVKDFRNKGIRITPGIKRFEKTE